MRPSRMISTEIAQTVTMYPSSPKISCDRPCGRAEVGACGGRARRARGVRQGAACLQHERAGERTEKDVERVEPAARPPRPGACHGARSRGGCCAQNAADGQTGGRGEGRGAGVSAAGLAVVRYVVTSSSDSYVRSPCATQRTHTHARGDGSERRRALCVRAVCARRVCSVRAAVWRFIVRVCGTQ